MTTQTKAATRIIKRKRGNVVRLLVELDASQAQELERVTGRLGMTRVDAISAALNIWLGMVKSTHEGGQ